MVGVLMVGNEASITPSYAEANGRKIQVQGDAVITVKPDVAYVTIGVETENEKSDVAQAENKKIMNAVMSVIKSNKISEKDIQTSNYNIYPVYRYDEKTGKSEVSAYRVSNSVEVTVRNIDLVGKLVDEVSENGANRIQSIRFGVQNEDQYYLEALAEAVNNGKQKAVTIGKAIGVNVGMPSEVIENYSGGVTYRETNYSVKAMMDTEETTPVSPGEVEVRASVSLSYEY